VNNILVAGIGSPFGADQLGWQVIDALQDHAQNDTGLTRCKFSKLDRPGAGLVDTLQGYQRVIMIDAVQAGKPRGTLVQLDAEQISEQSSGLSSHNFGVAEAIALARAMGVLPEDIVLFGLDAGDNPDVPFDTDEADKLFNRVMLELNEASVY